MKSRRIPLGLLYIATLLMLVILIPVIRFSGPHVGTLMHRQSSTTAFRLDNIKL